MTDHHSWGGRAEFNGLGMRFAFWTRMRKKLARRMVSMMKMRRRIMKMKKRLERRMMIDDDEVEVCW